jgi:hypothetical protein
MGPNIFPSSKSTSSANMQKTSRLMKWATVRDGGRGRAIAGRDARTRLPPVRSRSGGSAQVSAAPDR